MNDEVTDLAPGTVKFNTPLDKWLWTNRKTASWLAERTGVSASTISRMRNGLYTPPLETRLAIAAVTGISEKRLRA